MTNIHQLRLQTRIDSSAESGTREGNVGVTVPGQYTNCIDFKVPRTTDICLTEPGQLQDGGVHDP